MRDRRRPSATAYHEAGHAVACWAFGVRMHFATIVPEGPVGGQVRHVKGTPRHQLTVIRFAGPAAQRRSHPRSNVKQWALYDHALAGHTAAELYDAMHSRRSFLRQTAAEARALVTRHWYAVDQVARALMKRPSLSGHAIASVIERAEAEWQAATRHEPDLDGYTYARWCAVAGQGLPPLRRSHLEAAAMRAVLAGRNDAETAIVADLAGRGYGEAAIRQLWSRAAAQENRP